MRGSLTRIVPFLAALAAAVPATAGAQAPPTGGAPAPAPTAAPPPFALSGGGNAMLGRPVRFRGAVAARLRRRAVRVQSLDPVARAWTQVARTRVRADGTFIAHWRAQRPGRFVLRAVIRRRASASSVSPELPLTVYRPAIATWYGPGFYGNTTACGIVLTRELVGVAHRSLPCGTNVAVRYGAQTLVVPVVDRGPFGGEASWDLTEAAAQQLGFTDTDRIGTIRLPGAAQASR